MTKFYPVKLTKNDSCLTYVLKRIGCFNINKTYSLVNYLDYFDAKFIQNKAELKKGDIILWNKKMYFQNFQTEIDIDGNIIENKVVRNMHVAIVERIEGEEIIFSDCIINQENHGIPCVYVRPLTKRTPDLILTIK